MLSAEVGELVPALCNYLIQPSEENRKDTLQELSDVGIFLMALFRLLGADMLEEVSEKVAYNTLRYPSLQFQEGNYRETYKRLKKRQPEIQAEFYGIPDVSKQE